MPCNFISSCFFLDVPWHRDPDCLAEGPQPAQPAPADNWPLQELADPPQQQPVQHQPGVQPGVEVATGNSTQNGGTAAAEAGTSPPKDGPKSGNAPRAAKTFRAYLPSCHRTYSCVHCRAHLANHDELISKSFQGSQGRAYLFNSVVNIGCGQAEERVLLTGSSPCFTHCDFIEEK